ncbi:MAG: hypothetical protein N2445_01300 [Acidobacteria bacterium]|nr:hypothetical protein [Acidobacteriota bacterium]
MLNDHFFSLLIFSFLVSVFFAALYRSDFKSGVKSFLKTFLWMVLGSLAFAYLMFFTGS